MEALAFGQVGMTPWGLHPGAFAILLAALPLAAWIACAWHRALAADPRRARRAALRELRRLTRRLARNPRIANADLHAWLRGAAGTWGVTAAAPTASDLAYGLATLGVDADIAADWSVAWRDAERTLYGVHRPLPVDWSARAVALATASVPPPRMRHLPSRFADWWPRRAAAAGVALLLLVGAVPAPAGDDEPEAAALRALAVTPNDWGAQHAAALAYAARQDWGPALAHATAAFTHAPGHPATRELATLALDRAEGATLLLGTLLRGHGMQRLAGRASPATWQRIALAAALTGGAALATFVVVAYRRASLARSGAYRAVLGGLAFAAIVGAATVGAAALSWTHWGPLTQADSVVVARRADVAPVPSDLVAEVETVPVEIGTLAAAGRSFLGWRRVTTASGATGWLRRDAIVAVYAPR